MPLWDILKRLKSYTASEINKALGKSGKFWAEDYFDTYIRDEEHFENCVRYIYNNPNRAKLISTDAYWEWRGIKQCGPAVRAPVVPPF